MDSLLVEVRFDDGGSVGSVCAHRGAHSNWAERAQLAKRVDEILALPPAPACLAGTRLEFNRIAAREVEVEELIDECIRHPGTTGDQNSSVSGITLERELRRCVEHDQVQRGELWLHERGKPGSSPHVFVRSRGGADRRAAVRACADRSSFGLPVAVAPLSNDRVECLAGYGWVPFE